ncbi:hypothetical protein [Acetobacter nitrogenifigens]|uniref:hypothetical protein n=1 Tax=Acetobacter nitrogenifigens TaxID=285268 RepID=UPI0011BE5C5E|nr:hypothetical protein [Acetobacter nitrogenifigens]
MRPCQIAQSWSIRGVAPDIEIEPTSEQPTARLDPALEAADQALHGQTKRPFSGLLLSKRAGAPVATESSSPVSGAIQGAQRRNVRCGPSVLEQLAVAFGSTACKVAWCGCQYSGPNPSQCGNVSFAEAKMAPYIPEVKGET